MADLEADWMKEGARRVADDAWALIARHEQEDHDGEPCPSNRVGLVSFIAHVCGVPSSHAFEIAAAIAEYEHVHHNHA